MKNTSKVSRIWLFGAILANVVTLSLVASSPAHALDLSPVLGFGFASTSTSLNGIDQSLVISSKVTPILGGLVGLSMMPGLELEIGALYAPRKFGQTLGTTETVYQYNYLEFPVMARATVLPFIYPGLGFYYALAQGDISQTTTGFSGPSIPLTFDQANTTKDDFGIVGSLQVRLPVLPTLSILADARYLVGLKNVSKMANTTQKWKEFQLLFGVNFGI